MKSRWVTFLLASVLGGALLSNVASRNPDVLERYLEETGVEAVEGGGEPGKPSGILSDYELPAPGPRWIGRTLAGAAGGLVTFAVLSLLVRLARRSRRGD